jgi:hypothetical protein
MPSPKDAIGITFREQYGATSLARQGKHQAHDNRAIRHSHVGGGFIDQR